MVNKSGSSGYISGFQKHHILPLALERKHDLQDLAERGCKHQIDLRDFRSNGVLLPATEDQSQRTGLPLHRGPHPAYSEMVETRLASIQTRWQSAKRSSPISAQSDRLLRVDLLLKALRKKLMTRAAGRTLLNKKCPLGAGKDFTELDDMADSLWSSTNHISVAEFEPPSLERQI